MTNKQLVELAFDAAEGSDDPKTKVGCAILPSLPTRTVVTAANKFAKGTSPSKESVENSDQKRRWMVHAEIKAIAAAASIGIPTHEAKMAVTWFPCAECAKAIVEAEIKTLLAWKTAYLGRVNDPKYSFSDALEILKQGKVEIIWY